MTKDISKGIIALIAICLLAGCAGKIETVESYLQDKERVDQEISGKIGNWENAPEYVPVERKKTRKVYVVEVTEQADPVPVGTEDYLADIDSSYDDTSRSSSNRREVYTEPEITIPSFDDLEDEYGYQDGELEAAASANFVDYKVEKNDTLQKISKKFYDSYSKWPRIYEANKAKIKNPDSISPGVVLRIPME